MATNKLTPQEQAQITATLSGIIKAGTAAEPSPGSFASSAAARKDAISLNNDLLAQKRVQRDKLLKFICWMTALSFLLLATVVLLQMVIRAYIPNYVGASDFVINVITVSAFGEIVAIVASIAIAVWKDPDTSN